MALLDALQPGKMFGRLRLTSASFRRGERYRVQAICACGTSYEGDSFNVLSGNSQSCGCLFKEQLIARVKTHGESGSLIYGRWATMRTRCNNPANEHWHRYGGRGIKVCKRWESFENFKADMGDPPFPEAQLERKKNNKGYCPSNVVWATNKENSLNKERSLRYRYKGKERPLLEIAEMTGIKYMTLYHRLKTYNWPPEKAFNT
jgi:hypothetical protein